jgi:hypothetical protein
MDLITKSLTMNELEKYRIPVLHHITPSPSTLLYTKILRKFCKIIKSYLYPIVILFLAAGKGHGTGS